MKTRTAEVVLSIDAAPTVVWELLADVTTWSEWGLYEESRLETSGDTDPQGVGARRFLRAERMKTLDEVYAFEPPHRLSYLQLEGNVPARNYRSEVTLAPNAEGGTDVWWRASYEPKWFGIGWALDRNFKILLADTARRLKVRVETGAPLDED